MSRPTLDEVTSAIVASWSRETSHATEDYMDRGRAGDSSRGQCGTTALVLQDWLGGELLVTEVSIDGRVIGVHYWNQLLADHEVDLTIAQFLEEETLGQPSVSVRNSKLPSNGRDAYLLLSNRVEKMLESQHMARPQV